MSLYRDRHIRSYTIFLVLFSVLLFTSGMIFYIGQTKAAKAMFLSNERAMVSSLLEQGVAEEVIAAAVANTEGSEYGHELLAKLGMTEGTAVRFLPFVSDFQQKMGYFMLAAGVILVLLLFGGTLFFFWQRERLYQQASDIIENFVEGDYSRHLPQMCEGSIYQVFASVEQLVTMLKAKNDTEHQTKEFLKQTISDISHQLKTPLAALVMYQEIIEGEPENGDAVKAFSEKMGAA